MMNAPGEARRDLALVMDVSDATDLRCEIAPWLEPCGSCDAALPMGCTCPKGDVRVLLLRIYNALGVQPTTHEAAR